MMKTTSKYPSRLFSLLGATLVTTSAFASTDAIPFWIGSEPGNAITGGNLGSLLFSDNFRLTLSLNGTTANPGRSTLRIAASNFFLAPRNFTRLFVAIENLAVPAPTMELWLKNRTNAFERKGTGRMLTVEGTTWFEITNPNRYIQDGGFVHARLTFIGRTTTVRIDQVRFLFN